MTFKKSHPAQTFYFLRKTLKKDCLLQLLTNITF